MFLHEGPYLVGDHSEQLDVLKLELGELICVRFHDVPSRMPHKVMMAERRA